MSLRIKKRVSGFLTLHFPAHALLLAFLWFVLNFKVWVIFLYAYLAVMLGAFVYEMFRSWRHARERVYADEVSRLMFLLHELVDAAYVYGEDPAKFYVKFLEMISVESLRSRGIIDPDTMLRTPQYNRMCKGLDAKDAELWTLIMAGFDSRALKVIYGMSNINSVYVKRNRLKKRLSLKMQQLMDNKDAVNII